jgi:hypothetical protein
MAKREEALNSFPGTLPPGGYSMSTVCEKKELEGSLNSSDELLQDSQDTGEEEVTSPSLIMAKRHCQMQI